MTGFELGDGQQIEVRGRLAVYEQRGELQLIAESVQRAGEGDLFQQFMALKAKLEAEGLFEPARKRPLPAFPRAIGVVTSLGGAALHDVVHALQRRVPQTPVCVYAAGVQGAQAASELCGALRRAGERREVDVLLLVRGGGSMEDLWAYNDERLARAIVDCPMPVITGVGHETDFTIADFCADLRAPTPTAAAELCALPIETWTSALGAAESRLNALLQRRLQAGAQRLDWAANRLGKPSHLVTRQQARLSALAQLLWQRSKTRLERNTQNAAQLGLALPARFAAALRQHRQRVERVQFRLAVLDPRLVLQRGYAWLADQDGIPVIQARAVGAGQALKATLMDGEVDLTVTGTRPI